jgi:Domain of unknown function (DUF4386)
MNQQEIVEGVESKYKWLIRLTGICAIISAALIPISIIAFFIWPLYPIDIFTVIQNDRIAGLMGLDLLYLAGTFLSIPIFLTFYVTLKQTSESFSLLAVTLGFIGLVALFSARPIVEMVALSDQYASATTEIQKMELQSAGLALMAHFRGTTFNIHYVLGTTSLLISSIIMLRSKFYSKTIAYTGIVTNVLVFTNYVPTIGLYLSVISVIGYLIWWLMIGKLYLEMSSRP